MKTSEYTEVEVAISELKHSLILKEHLSYTDIIYPRCFWVSKDGVNNVIVNFVSLTLTYTGTKGNRDSESKENNELY